MEQNFLDIPDDIKYAVKLKGIDENVVKRISYENNEPDWMLQHRMESLKVFNEKVIPDWGPDLSDIDFDEIVSFSKAESMDDYATSWDDVPDELKNKFERLGIPEAERTYLAGAGGQFDSETVYHKIKDKWADQGVIFEDMNEALHKHEDLVKEYFMKLVPASDHKFAALHGALWSGGTFIYVPKGVKLTDPLQAYFRMNTLNGGQFEHTLIIVDDDAEGNYIEGCSAPQYSTKSIHAGMVEVFVGKNSKMRYSSVENWSTNTDNLNTKRSLVHDNGYMEWVGGNFGSGKTMLYPMTILKGEKSRAEHLGVAFAGKGQEQDTGGKVLHIGKDSSSKISSKSISKDGGISTYRGMVKILPSAENAVNNTQCDAIIVDEDSVSNTIPDIQNQNSSAVVAHEASAGKIDEDTLFYLTSRGISQDQAAGLLVNGFVNPVVKKLPLEYSGELNRLIEMEMEGAIG